MVSRIAYGGGELAHALGAKRVPSDVAVPLHDPACGSPDRACTARECQCFCGRLSELQPSVDSLQSGLFVIFPAKRCLWEAEIDI
jgi:hypothetical protein